MVPITGEFQAESPLHPAAAALLAESFARGWADPHKLHRASRQAGILLAEAKEIYARHLGIRSDWIHFLGEPDLGFHLGISGLLLPNSTLFYTTTDREEVLALVQSPLARLNSLQIPVDRFGQVDTTQLEAQSQDVLIWQLANGETGTVREPLSGRAGFSGSIFIDATASGAEVALPSTFSCALWDAQTWAGPTGLGILAIDPQSQWRNPLPSLSATQLLGSFSIPLALSGAVALEHWISDRASQRTKLTEMNLHIRNFLQVEISDVDIVETSPTILLDRLSFSFLYVDAEQLVNEMSANGYSVDSGSACASSNVEFSHVLAAMGYLTHGNIRMRLRNDITWPDVHQFLSTLKSVVEKLRTI